MGHHGAQAQVAINSTGAAPVSTNAMLEIASTDRGLLIPRMTRNQRVAIATPPNGLLVYQTNDAGSEVMGFYYYDAAVVGTGVVGWRHLGQGGPVWQLGGNAGTTNAHFVGTLNNYPLVLRTGNQERGRLTENGQLQLYSQYPNIFAVYPSLTTEMVHVQGGVKLNGGSAGNQPGTIRFVPPGGGTPGRFEGYVQNAGLGVTAPAANGWKQIDNNFHERRLQQAPLTSGGCQDPSNTSLAQTMPPAASTTVAGGARPWPMTGPSVGLGTLGGGASPFYGLWEDSHKQYLYRADDLSAAGICMGSDNPIRAMAFNVTGVVYTSTTRQHYVRIRMKNTGANTTATFDNTGLAVFARPTTGQIAGPPVRYYNPYPPAVPANPPGGETAGFDFGVGWNIHPYDQGGPGFVWTGNNLLIDVAVDNQTWPVKETVVQSYNSGYQSLIYMYCDACGGSGGSPGAGTCLWRTAPTVGFYWPPTAPYNGEPGAGPGTSNSDGWGYMGGWDLTNGTNTVACDGQTTTWGGFGPATSNQLPRVAFLAKYTGGGAAFNVGSYMYANEALMVGDAAWAASGAFAPPPSTLRHRGPGTLSAQKSVWSGGTLLTDYVFDLYYDGVAKPEDAKGAGMYSRVPLRDLPNYVEQNHRLPNVEGRTAWNTQGSFSLDQITNQLWVAVEDQALYIQELNQRMDALRAYLVEKKLREMEGK